MTPDNRRCDSMIYPDFIVKTKDAMYIIETKSAKDANTDTDTKRKAIAASERYLQISRIKNIPSFKDEKGIRNYDPKNPP